MAFGTADRIAYDGLALFSPIDGHAVIKDLTVEIPRGTRVLVVGPNEGARIALFRATAGIWPTGEGKIVTPPLDAIFFLPQRPYMPPGTLRDLLLRTGQEGVIPDDQITAALLNAGLEPVLKRAGGLETEHDWPAILSLGEQQELAITRLLLARPAFAMLDRIGDARKAPQVRQARSCWTRVPLPTSLSPRRPTRLTCTTRSWRSTPMARGAGRS